MPTGVYKRTKKRTAWSPERRARYEETLRKKGCIVGGTPQEHRRLRYAADKAKRAAKAAAGGAATEFPLDAIPERAPKQARKVPVAVLNGFGNGHGKLADKVHAEYDVTSDQMTLVLGKLRLPFRVKV